MPTRTESKLGAWVGVLGVVVGREGVSTLSLAHSVWAARELSMCWLVRARVRAPVCDLPGASRSVQRR